MPIFQCDKCGCAENSAITKCSHSSYKMNVQFENDPTNLALNSYKKIIGIDPSMPFGRYCSACCPVWFNNEDKYGVGPNPNPKPGCGLWHNKFRRMFLPKGQFSTARNGNLMHTETQDEDVAKWKLAKEEGT